MACVYHIVPEKKPFPPTDYEKLMNPQNHVEHVALNENNAFAYFECLGYDSSKLVKRNDNYTLYFWYFILAKSGVL